MRYVLLVVLLVVLLPSTSNAQSAPVAFLDLPLVLKQGDVITVSDASGARVTGRVQSLSPNEVRIFVVTQGRMGGRVTWETGPPRRFLESQVESIERTDLDGRVERAIYRRPSAAVPVDNLKSLRVGHRAIVLEKDGTVVAGKVIRLSPSEVVLTPKNQPGERIFPLAQVRRIQRVGNLWDGALKGFVYGALPLIIQLGSTGWLTPKIFAAATGVSIGAGLGIDAAWGPETVYEVPPGARRLAIQPILSGARQGVRFMITF